jgi:RimJ/RimL family protein N-acetyltransferase
MTEPIELLTERLLLSVPLADDAEAIASACQDPEVQRWTTVPSPYALSDARSFVSTYVAAGWESGVTRTWAVRLRTHTGAVLVGMVGLEGVRDGAGEVGYWLAPTVRGQRIMVEAVAAVLEYGFDPAGAALQRVQWRAYVGNVPSARVARGAGFRFEGVRRLGALGRTSREDEWTAAVLSTDDRSPAEGWPLDAIGR